MRDVLENKRDSVRVGLLLKQRVRELQEILVTLEMIPGRCITIRNLSRLFYLPSIHTSLALERLVCITALGRLVELEQLPQVLLREMTLNILILIHHTGRQRLLVRLTLENLFLNRSCRNESVDKTILLLAIAPHTRQGLLVRGWVPVWVKKNKTVRSNQVQSTSSCLAAQQEYELIAIRVIEPVDQLLSLVDRHRSI